MKKLLIYVGCVVVLAATGVAAFAAPRGFSGWTPPRSFESISNTPTNISYYENQYGFFRPNSTARISSDELARLKTMLPYAALGSAKINSEYKAHTTPMLLLWWTHSEGIRARVNYSNCANHWVAGGYLKALTNCNVPSFWQLGYGTQFSYTAPHMVQAFRDMYGDPNNKALVQKIGQEVLDYDASQGANDASFAKFPAMTVDQIVKSSSTSHQTPGNWWASVLARSPGVNSWALAYGLQWFNRASTRGWVGCYYAAPCWQNNSNRLGDIMSAWPSITAGYRPPTPRPSSTTPVPTKTAIRCS